MSGLPRGGMVGIVMKARSGGAIRKRVACVCGYRAEGPDDADLNALIRHHLDRIHPELPYSEEEIRRWVTSGTVFVAHPAFWPARDGRR